MFIRIASWISFLLALSFFKGMLSRISSMLDPEFCTDPIAIYGLGSYCCG